jgi:CxxC-x17-CxxC domain-containing protein
MYVIGKTGVGKTVLLKNMALQDIENGEGMAIVDPHGEFIEEILDKIPASRVKDVVYFNPADTEYPISFNILDVPDPKYKHLIASGLIGIFTKVWANVWSARMEYILDNCILALLDTPNTTLLGVLRILADAEYRQKIINNIQDPVVKSFWVNEYTNWPAQYKNEAIAPIQNKVGQFLNVSIVRNIVGQPKSSINVSEIMDSQKILLVNVSKGKIGEDNSALLGAMIITKIQLAAMERIRISEEKRKDFYLYVDEFQNFVTESFANILSEARKYHLNLIVAHQYIGQLVTTESTEKVRDAVFGNAGTLVTFRVGAADAEFLEKEYTPTFVIQDLVNLPNYNIYLKMMIDGIASQPFSATTLSPITVGKGENNREEIVRFSREKYSKTRQEVDEKIARWAEGLAIGIASSPSRPSASGLYDAVCALCKKSTKVIFPPDSKRSVYCKSCLKKINDQKKMSAIASPTPPAPTFPSASIPRVSPVFPTPSPVPRFFPPSHPPFPSIFPKKIENSKMSEKTEGKNKEFNPSGATVVSIPAIPTRSNAMSLEKLLSKEPIFFKSKKEKKENAEDGNDDKEKLKQALMEALNEEKKKEQKPDSEQRELKPGEIVKF